MFGYGFRQVNRSILGAGGGGNPLWNGLQAYYTADNTPNDALGNYNGTLINGATYGTGIINNGFSFDGVNDYVDFGVVSDFNFGTSNFTVSMWVNWSVNRTLDAIFSIGSYRYQDGGFTLYATTTQKLDFWYRDNTSVSVNVGSTPDNSFVANIWNNVVLRRVGSNLDVFINNVKYSLSSGFTDSLGNSIGKTVFGDNEYNLFFIGLIDEIAFFNSGLSDTEVTELYNSGAGLQYPN